MPAAYQSTELHFINMYPVKR